MALVDVTNKPPKFRLRVDLEAEYATLQSAHLLTNIPHDQQRQQGVKAIDLWTDGALYPIDPLSGTPAPFRNTAMLLHFIGNGYSGLLGYCKNLHTLSLDEAGRRRAVECAFEQLQESSRTGISRLTDKVHELLE